MFFDQRRKIVDGPNRQYFVAKVLLYAYYIKVTNVDAFTNAEQLSQVGQLNGMPGDPPPGGANVILIKTILEHNFTLHKYNPLCSLILIQNGL